MKLKRFIDIKKMTIQALANSIGISHESARRYVHETRYPRPETASKIVSFTRGKVSMDDIYGSRT